MLRLQEIKFQMIFKIFISLTKVLLVSLNDELKEDDYDDIEDNKIVREANEGWLGITDKYWMTVLVPEKGKNFKSTFQYNDAFKANYIINDPIKINASSNGSK